MEDKVLLQYECDLGEDAKFELVDSRVDSSDKCNTPLIFECVVENFIRGSVPESLPGSLV